ncbi:MAG: metallophosphoesterase family protein [Methanoregula sp.]|uniref:metallophosphoesterase family protein n=1 Tax=Methanoregula sp. TaxID=2052170 RepID=UPI003C614048
MGTVIFSDVHADADALGLLAAYIRNPLFPTRFGPVDTLVNLGDLLHRGNCPQPTLALIHDLAKEFRLVSVVGNHDHAFLNSVPVSGSDEMSTYRHEQLRGSPLLDIFSDMPMEWVDGPVLFVHGGPLDLGTQTLRLKCWQRLSHTAGDSFTGYHYTAPMAFDALEKRGLAHMVCGHQHTHICCRKTMDGIREHALRFVREKDILFPGEEIEVARIPLDMPTLFRLGGCHGKMPEFAYADRTTFTYLRVAAETRCVDTP